MQLPFRNAIFGENAYPVVAIIGKTLSPCGNKMDVFDLLDTPASLRHTSDPSKSFNGRTIFYVDTVENVIYLHFETAYDDHLLKDLVANLSLTGQDNFQINAVAQSQFAKVFLFAASVCHLMVLTDPGSSFNSAYLPLFKALSGIREHKFLKYAGKSPCGPMLFHHLGKELRLCAPKIIFLFEKPEDLVANESQLEQHEIDMEHSIFATLKAENLLSKNTCLFVLPKKLPFVYVNRSGGGGKGEKQKGVNKMTQDPVKESMQHLMSVLNSYATGQKTDEIVEPHVGYARPFRCYTKEFVDSEIEAVKEANHLKKHSLKRLIKKHIKDIVSSAAGGVNSSTTTGDNEGAGNKTRNNPHRPNMPNAAVFLEIFETMHGMLMGQDLLDNPDPEYVSNKLKNLLFLIHI